MPRRAPCRPGRADTPCAALRAAPSAPTPTTSPRRRGQRRPRTRSLPPSRSTTLLLATPPRSPAAPQPAWRSRSSSVRFRPRYPAIAASCSAADRKPARCHVHASATRLASNVFADAASRSTRSNAVHKSGVSWIGTASGSSTPTNALSCVSTSPTLRACTHEIDGRSGCGHDPTLRRGCDTQTGDRPEEQRGIQEIQPRHV